MKRLKSLAAAGLTALALTLGLAPAAHANQQIDCQTQVLDTTAAQGVSHDSLWREIALTSDLHPSAASSIYLQAYEQMPGGSIAGFWELAKQQCPNWFSDDGRADAQLLVVAYGHDIDRISVNYGNDFELALGWYGHDIMMNGVNSSLGPEYSQMNPDYVTSAIADATRAIRVGIEKSRYFDKSDGLYKPPADVGPTGYEPTDWREMAGMILLVAAGFAVFGILCWFAQTIWRKVTSDPAN